LRQPGIYGVSSSIHYWKIALAGDPTILGRPLQIGPSVLSVNGKQLTVVAPGCERLYTQWLEQSKIKMNEFDQAISRV
jgi:hypothetical protein